MSTNLATFSSRHLAASEGSYKVTEWLLSEKADINALDRFKRTPLEVSFALVSQPHTSRVLHDISVCVVRQDAVRGEFNELSKLLIDHGGKMYQDGQVDFC